MTKKIVILLGLVMLLFPVVYADKLADFTLKDADGNDVNIYKDVLNNGQIAVIDFWATWCVPCCLELPHLNTMHEENEEVTVVIVSEDSKRSLKRAAKYIKEKGYTVISLYDPTGEVKKLLGVEVMPETFYVQPDGEIVYHHKGYKKGEEIEMFKHLDEAIDHLNAKTSSKKTTEHSTELPGKTPEMKTEDADTPVQGK